MIDRYLAKEQARHQKGIPAEPLSPEQTRDLCRLFKSPADGQAELLLNLLTNRVPPGVDAAAKVKASFLGAIARKEITSPLINVDQAVTLLGAMMGGYNINLLIEFLDDKELAPLAARELANSIFIFDDYQKVADKASTNKYATQVMESWAAGEWFSARPQLPQKITLTIFKVDGEITTDDFSPAGEAGTRSDIPRHALAMLRSRLQEPLQEIATLKKLGHPLAFVGDVVGTGSSRKSAVNSLLWHIGKDIPGVPNKRRGGVVIGAQIAPIFFNTLEDAGALPLECDVSGLTTGTVVTILPYEGQIIEAESGQKIATFSLKSEVLLDEVQAGGRIALIAGRTLTNNVRRQLGLEQSNLFKADCNHC